MAVPQTGPDPLSRSAEMETALGDLRTTIPTAEDTLSRAKEAADLLTVEAEATGDVESQQLAAETDAAIVQFATALDGAREALATAGTQTRPSKENVPRTPPAPKTLMTMRARRNPRKSLTRRFLAA